MGMGELRTGKEKIKSGGSSRKLSSYTPFISWQEDEAKNLFFLTPIDEVPKVLMHQWVKKVVPGEKPRFMTFMCRKDPAWRDESNGECLLCDVFGLKPTERYAALAVEVDPVTSGKRITGVTVKHNEGKDREGNDVEYPAIGMVMQSAKFFGTLVAHDQKRDISELSWEITREGSGLTTSYIFYPLEHQPVVDDLQVPDLREILSYYGSVEKYDNDIDEHVDASDQFQKVGDVGKPVVQSKSDDSFSDLKDSLDKTPVESY